MAVPHISRPILGFFRRIVSGYFRRHFRAVRVSGAELLATCGGGPLIVYANHSSWWDPMVLVLLASELLPQRRHFAPMDATALERYGILKRIGVFGVETQSPRGAAQFLRRGLEILNAGNVIWVTPQGRFADVRDRPLAFKRGLAELASRVPKGCTLLPLAIEYTFWDERLPETFLQFGQPIFVNEAAPTSIVQLETALLHCMDSLRQKVVARDPAGFEILQSGRVGTGGWYQMGQHLFARMRGKQYQAEHTAFPTDTAT